MRADRQVPEDIDSPRLDPVAASTRGRRGRALASDNEGPGAVALGVVLTSAMAYGTITFFVLAVLSPFLVADLGLTRAQLGLLPTLIYGLGAALSPLGGSLSDRFGGRRLIMSLFASSAIGLAALSLASSYALVITAVLITSWSTAITNPGTNQLIARYVSPSKRGIVTGIKQSGIQLGGLVLGATLPALALALGWRAAAAAVATSALALLAFTAWRIPRSPARANGGRLATRRRESGGGETSTATRWIAAYGFLMSFGVASIGVYLPLYVVQDLGFTVVVAGLATSTLSAVGVTTKFLTGARLRNLVDPRRAIVLTAILAMGGTCLLILAPQYGAASLWSALILVGVSTSAWQIIAIVAIINLVPLEQAGKTSGTMQLAFYGGFATSPALLGVAIDRLGGYTTAWFIVGGAFSLALLVAIAWNVVTSRHSEAPQRRP